MSSIKSTTFSPDKFVTNNVRDGIFFFLFFLIKISYGFQGYTELSRSRPIVDLLRLKLLLQRLAATNCMVLIEFLQN
jgi:hypothetical protein